MRSLNYVIGIILLLSFAVTGLAQDWQLIRYVNFEDGSNGGQSDLVYQDERFTLSGPFAPILHYGDHSLAFVASNVSPYILQTPEPVGFQLQLTPDFEYRFSLSVETWSGNDIGFYLVGPDQQEILINGPVGTRQRDPSWTPGNVDLRDLYINGWDVIRISNTFTVPTAGEYYVYIRHYNSSNTYVGSSTYETMYDLYDLFKLEARPLNNTTHLSFSQTTPSITEGSSTQLCVDISNPSTTIA